MAEATAQVTSVQVNGGAAQRSRVTLLTVTFNRLVVPDAGAFALTGGDGAGVGTAVSFANPEGDGRTWVLTFGGAPVFAGSLADGVYDLRVVAASIHTGSAAGQAMAADLAAKFHRLFSDSDGDGDSDNADLFQVRATYNKPPDDAAFKSWFDYEGDGDVDNADLFQVRARRATEFKGY